ncbi:MAG: hypothetical protein ABI823_06370 [Bryobacteraceae bacterium]
MPWTIKDIGALPAMAATLVIAYLGLRILVDPGVFLRFCIMVAAGIRQFADQAQSRSGKPRQRFFESEEFSSSDARKFARLAGLVLLTLGLAGLFIQLSQLF